MEDQTQKLQNQTAASGDSVTEAKNPPSQTQTEPKPSVADNQPPIEKAQADSSNTQKTTGQTEPPVSEQATKAAKPKKSDEQPIQQVSATVDVKGAHWYVVHTYSGHEAKVAATLKQRVESQRLQDKILDILVPTQEKIEIKEGKKSTVKEKIFPGYLLIRMILDDNTWLAVRTTPGITSFVGNSNKPTPLPEDEVASIKKFMAMEAPKFKTTFSIGEAIRIVDGPFSEFLGSINEIDEEKGKLKVMVSIFGRETPVELDFLQVAKL